jgi:hypothetical protein
MKPVLLVVTLAIVGASAASQPDVSQIGPKIGAIAPEFSLPDQHGNARTLKSVLGPSGTILVFFRSADW